MTDLITTHANNSQPEGLLATWPLLHLLAHLRGLRDEHRIGTQDWRFLSRDIARYMRELLKLEKHNHFIKAKWEMLRDPAWRARVLSELGGEKAMQRWERRFAKAQDKVGQPEPSPVAAEPVSGQAPDLGPTLKPEPKPKPLFPEKRTAKTDESGTFRLAPIMRGLQKRAKRFNTPRRFRTYSWDPSWDEPKPFPPTPVTPGELRGVGIDDAPEDDDPELEAKLISMGRPAEPSRLTGRPPITTDPSRRGSAAPQDEGNGETNNNEKTLILRRPKAVSKDEGYKDVDVKEPP